MPGATPALPAPGMTFPHGLFDFSMTGCTPGSTLAFTIVYPGSLTNASYWKYGPTAANHAPHWYVLPSAAIAGTTATFTITDGGDGDDDLTVNGGIVDQGGPGVPGPGGQSAQVPTLSEWALFLLGLAMLGLGLHRMRGRGRMSV
jgi:hypothetical protein